MNNRIRELVEQAVVAVDVVTGNESLDDELAKMYIPDCFAEKFAELIVRECAEIGDGYDNETKYNQGLIDIQTAGDEIRKHFGVEK